MRCFRTYRPPSQSPIQPAGRWRRFGVRIGRRDLGLAAAAGAIALTGFMMLPGEDAEPASTAMRAAAQVAG